MGTGAALAIAAGALVLVFVVTKAQEQKTAAMVAHIQQSKAFDPNDPLSFQDVFAVGATAAATYFGGIGAGAKAASAFAPR